MLLRSLAVLIVFAPFAAAAEIRTLTGQKLTGDLVAIDSKQIVLKTATGEVATPIKQILTVDLQSPAGPAVPKFMEVELTDGTLLRCDDVKIKGKTVVLTLAGVPAGPGQVLEVPMAAVFYVVRDGHDAAIKKEWSAFLAKRGKRDVLVVKKEGRFDGLEGTADQGDDTGEIIEFELATGAKTKIKLSRLSGLIFNQVQTGETVETLCRVTDAMKNVYAAKDITRKGDAITLTTVSGVKVEFPKTQLVAKLDYSKDKITYLSDMEPVEVKLPGADDFGPAFARDTNLDGVDPIKLNNVVYIKGLAVHAPAAITYNLNGDYKEFKAVLGVDDSVQADKAVRVVIEGDNRPIFQAEFRRKDPPKPIVVNIKDVRFLRVVVDTSEFPLNCQAALADARVNK